MKVADFELYKTLLYDKSGLVITPDKSYLLIYVLARLPRNGTTHLWKS